MPAYEGPKALGFSRYANTAQKPSQPATVLTSATGAFVSGDSAVATKQQIATLDIARETSSPAAELAVERGASLKREVEDHTVKLSRAVSNAVLNTRQLLSLLRQSTPHSELVDNLWHELERVFQTVDGSKAAITDFMEKQRNNMSLYHSSIVNETIRETQAELDLQHKKINTQHDLILEQQDAFQDYKAQTASSLKELQGLQERISRLTLEKGNFRTEVEKYKELLQNEMARNAEKLKAEHALHETLKAFESSRQQLQAENESLRKTATDQLEQLKSAEQTATDRITRELATKSGELQDASAKVNSLSTLLATLRNGEISLKKELEKVKNDNRLISVKYNNQTAEHARAFSVF